MSAIGGALIAVFLALAGLHLYWGFGGRWPGHDDASLVRIASGAQGGRMYGLAPCAAVAFALTSAAAIVYAGHSTIMTSAFAWVVIAGFVVLILVFGGRGLAPYVSNAFDYARGTPFFDLNRQFYAPLSRHRRGSSVGFSALMSKAPVISLLTLSALCLLATPAVADDFVPGRPGNTESPISVPVGHWQIETELGGYARASGDAKSWSALQTDIRYGLAPGWDAEAIIAPYVGEDVGGARAEGFGDTTLRVRHTFTGQDGNGPAFALIGFVTLPTGTNGQSDGGVEGGLIGTGSFPLSSNDAITYTMGAAAVSDDGNYKSDLFGGANLTHQFTETLAAYVELFADRSAGQTAETFDIGGTFLTDAHTQWDAGVDLGLSDAADNARIFVGWAHLF